MIEDKLQDIIFCSNCIKSRKALIMSTVKLLFVGFHSTWLGYIIVISWLIVTSLLILLSLLKSEFTGFAFVLHILFV